jgi:hypothetical protein
MMVTPPVAKLASSAAMVFALKAACFGRDRISELEQGCFFQKLFKIKDALV